MIFSLQLDKKWSSRRVAAYAAAVMAVNPNRVLNQLEDTNLSDAETKAFECRNDRPQHNQRIGLLIRFANRRKRRILPKKGAKIRSFSTDRLVFFSTAL